MPLDEVNWIAVLISMVAGMATGAFWYSLLAKPWMSAAGITEEMIKGEDGKQSPMPYVVAAISNLLIATMLFGILVHVGEPTVWRGVLSSFFIWIGFVITTMSVNNAYQMKPARLTIIDGGHWLLNLVIQGAILGWFG